MTATDKLRRMLDERGVKYRTHGTTDRTWFEVGNISWFIIERENGSLTADAVFLTPEQAIAATLGAGTCEADETDTIKCWVKCKDKPSTEHMELIHVMECSACGGTYEHVSGSYEFCPRCGRKLVTP